MLWASLALIFGFGGIAFGNGAELIGAVFCLLMALVSAVLRDWHINQAASDDLNHTGSYRVGYEREDRA